MSGCGDAKKKPLTEANSFARLINLKFTLLHSVIFPVFCGSAVPVPYRKLFTGEEDLDSVQYRLHSTSQMTGRAFENDS